MNFKMLFPSYRNRFLFVMRQLKKAGIKDANFLHLGCGEGDYDPHLLPFAKNILAGDINSGDVAFAKKVNARLKGLDYQVLDALNLPLEANTMDVVVAVDTLEHVNDPAVMMKEIARVLKPGGVGLITFPRYEFPITYDPINFMNQIFDRKPLSQGAYAFNHTFLIKNKNWQTWCEEVGLLVIGKERISGWLVALLEMYWTGWVQRLFKSNSDNKANHKTKWAVRSDAKAPSLVFLTDLVLLLDKGLNVFSKRSIGLGLIVRKNESE